MRCPRCHAEVSDTSKFCAECGSSLRPSSSPEGLPTKTIAVPVSPAKPGELLAGKYRIIDELGRGGMGVVVRAEDTRLKRTVALKFLSQELTGDPEARERFVQEARAASALEHPNICTIHEIDEAPDGRMFMAMACYEGESLRDRIKRGKLDHTEGLSIAVQAARGLAKAHEKGIVHRDIKPGNIFLTHDGQAKILDFGLAKLASDIRMTKTGATLGTVAYMSPEQAQGKPVDSRTDVWSLGVMLYEMLTGRLPFGGETEGSLVHAIIYRPAKPLGKADPAIPAEIERVVLRALEKNPEDRYRTMADFLSDLESLAEGLKPLKAGPSLFRGRILGVRKPAFYGGVVALAAAAALLVFTFLIPSAQADVLDSIAILPLVNASGDPAQDHLAFGLTETLISELYKVGALQVRSRQAVMAYRNSDKPPKKIAQELRVKALVEASFLRSGDMIRLTARLIDPFRDRIVWDETLEKDATEYQILEREFARAVVAAVKVAVTPSEQALLAGGRKVDPEAYDLLMKGIALYWQPPNDADFDPRKSLEFVEKAIKLDPELALAYAWQAFLHINMAGDQIENPKVGYPIARKAVEKALAFEDDLAMAFVSRGWIKNDLDWNFAGAEQDFLKALSLAPGDMTIPLTYESFLCHTGRADEAIESLRRRTARRKPVGFELRYAERQALHYLWAGRYVEALDELAKIPMTGSFLPWITSVAKALNGNTDEALATIDSIKGRPSFDLYFKHDHAWILALAGRRGEAIRVLEEHTAALIERGIDTAFDEARVYAGLGEKDKAYEHRSQQMFVLVSDWALHPLHGDPRFEELARKIGFPVIPGPRKALQ